MEKSSKNYLNLKTQITIFSLKKFMKITNQNPYKYNGK